MRAPYVDCSSAGCSATYETSQDFIDQLSRGNGLAVQGINGAGKPVSLVVPLANFARALNGPSSATRQPRTNPAGTLTGKEKLFYSPWTKFCLKGDGANAKNVCFTGKDARIESGPVAAAVLIEPVEDPKKILRVTLPLNISIGQGTNINIDQGQALNAPFVICFQNGCMADYEASNELINRLRTGRDFLVQGTNSDGRPLRWSLPLADFAKAHDGPAIDPKVFQAQQKKLQEDLAGRARR